MKRRAVFVSLLIPVFSGCLSVFQNDSDGDGVADSNDAAPADPRVSEYVTGDPPPGLRIDQIGGIDGNSTKVSVTHGSGESFTRENTGRLELASEGAPIDTIDLPFQVGDEQISSGVPVGQRVVLIWFSPNGENAQVVAAAEFEG